VIELLGVGVWERGRWRVRGCCARLEGPGLVAIVAGRRDERLALLDVVAGRVVPSEGRAWINGTPLMAETASRIRRRAGVVDVATPLAPDRTVAWNVLGDVVGLPWRASAGEATPMLERVGLAVDARCLASRLDGWDRLRLLVARALRASPARLVVGEPDAHLGSDDVGRLLGLLRGMAARDRLPILVSLADASLAREADVVVTRPLSLA
jgi:ABC-type ATPase involved in cell division